MNLKQLRYFIKIAETQNMSRAAEGLNIAQTALGLQVKNLEAELGVALLERHSRGVRVTPAGQVFYNRAVKIQKMISETISEIREMSGNTEDPILMGITPSMMQLVGAELLSHRETGEKFQFVEALSFHLLEALHRDEINCALAFNIPEEPGIKRHSILDESLFFVSSPESPNNGVPITFHEVTQSDLALLSRRDIIWNIVHDTAHERSVDIRVAFEVQSQSAIKTLVERGVACSIMPFGTIADEVSKGTLHARPIADSKLHRTLYFAYSENTSARQSTALLEKHISYIINIYAAKLGRHAQILLP
ncbi:MULTISPECIES: LysR family transcriptional regulator [unclassified Thalassospira]|uniref:LysR family transcriptional regulator n=1 Tax=unclassified Thalassospira TaxID=2648997 RepID=UPI001B08C0D5|nr:LysR family transcriptional regulator [Thalassospira sp.]MBO6773411.1 LysR family transcriptional regulator [Thalassospira sp.]